MKTLFTTLTLFLINANFHAQQSIVLQPNAINGKDAWIWSMPQTRLVNFGVPNSQSGGLHNVIRSETWQWTQGRFDTIRSLIEFDLSSLPQNATIDSAKLDLYFFKNPNFTSHIGTNLSHIHPITQAWNEATVNWQNQPSFDQTVHAILPNSISSTQNYTGIDVTNLVIDQIQNQNHGWLIKLVNESGFNGLTFASSDHSTSSLHPRLRVYYHLSTSIKKKQSNLTTLSIYPNPGNGIYHLEGLPLNNSDTRLECFNLQGRLQNIEIKYLDNTISFNIKNQTNGVYILKVSTGDEVRLFRLIKIKP